MKPRHKRIAIIVGGVATLGIAGALVLSALQSNVAFFFTPSQVVALRHPEQAELAAGRETYWDAEQRTVTCLACRGDTRQATTADRDFPGRGTPSA